MNPINYLRTCFPQNAYEDPQFVQNLHQYYQSLVKQQKQTNQDINFFQDQISPDFRKITFTKNYLSFNEIKQQSQEQVKLQEGEVLLKEQDLKCIQRQKALLKKRKKQKLIAIMNEVDLITEEIGHLRACFRSRVQSQVEQQEFQ